MANNKFIVTGVLKLQPDGSNLAGLTKAINKALKQTPKNLNVDLKVRVNNKSLNDAKRGLTDLTKNINVKQITKLNDGLKKTSEHSRALGADLASIGTQAALATRRFGGFVIGTFAIRELGFAFKETFKDALNFQESLVKVGQVTKTSLRDLRSLEGAITKVSTSLGVDSEALIDAAQTLSQAGLTLKDTETALSALAKTTLSPSFGELTDTTEGLISAMAQFKINADGAEGVLSSINAIAAKTAVESEDLIDVIKRTGGAFQATGGDLNELLALFTAVRATTRESAGTIGTGFRTIFTRLQRPGTIEFLNSLGIELRDANNQFIGGFEAVRKLSQALNSIPSTDTRFAQIVEELGGIRQVSKVIPLIKQFSTAEEALQIALQGTDSIQQDVIRSQESMLRQFREIKEEFKELIRQFANNQAVKQLVTIFLELSRALLNVSQSFIPLLPLFAALGGRGAIAGANKFLKGTPGGARGFLGTLVGFNSGGAVGGIGTGDTVPAMLTPGEFVLRKDAVKKIGTGTLNAINSGVISKFASGGIVGKLGGANAAAAGALGAGVLISLFTGLDDSLKALTTSLLAVGAQFLIFKKTLAPPNSSPIKGTTDVKLERIFTKNSSTLANLNTKEAEDRRGIDLRKQSIGGLSGFLKQTEREGQRRTDEIAFHNEDISNNILKLTSEIAKIDDQLAPTADQEKNARFLLKNEDKIRASRNKELAVTRQRIKELDFQRGFELDPKQKAEEFFTLNPQLRGVVPESIAGAPTNLDRIDRELREQRQRAQQLQAPIVSLEDRALVSKSNDLRQIRAALSRDLDITRNTPFQRELNDPLLASRSRAKTVVRDLSDEVSALEAGLPTQQDKQVRQSRINRVARIRRFRAVGARINSFAAPFAAVGSVGGAALESFGRGRTAAGDRSGVGLAAGGGALSGAAQGALFGSLIAPALGPLAPFGIAIGAAGGAALGFARSLAGATDEVEAAELHKTVENLQKTLESVSAGRTPIGSGAGLGVGSALRTIQDRIRTSKGESLISAKGEFDNISTGVQKFFVQVAQNSSTFEQFTANAGSALTAFSELSGIPLKDLNKQFADQIKAQQEGIETQKLLNQASFEAGLQLRASLAFMEGLSNSAQQIERFGNSIKSVGSVLSGQAGGLQLDEVESIKSSQFLPGIANLSGFFGKEASSIFSELETASKALEILPDILIDLRSNRLGEGDIDLRLRQSLSKNLGVSPSNDVVSKLINTFREIGGEEGEPKFLQALETDFAGTIEKFDNAFNTTTDIVKQASANVQAGLQEYAAGLEQAANIEMQLTEMRRQSIDTVIEAEKTLAGVFNRDVDFGKISELTNRRNGPRSPGELGFILQNAKDNVAGIQGRLDRGEFSGFAESRQLIQERQAELVTIQKARDALGQLADVSNTTGNKLEELAKLRERQGIKREFASSFIFGDSAQKRDIGIGIQGAIRAAQQGNLQGIPDSQRGQVLDIFRQFADVPLASLGGTGLEAEKRVLRGEAQLAGVPQEFLDAIGATTGTQEKKLQDAIVAGITTSFEAQQQLQKDALTTQQTLLSVTETGFKNVVVGFRDAILEGQQIGLKSRLQQTQNNIATLNTQNDAFKQLSALGVTTPAQLASLRTGIPQQAIGIDTRIKTLQNLQNTVKATDSVRGPSRATNIASTIEGLRQSLQEAGVTPEEIDNLKKQLQLRQPGLNSSGFGGSGAAAPVVPIPDVFGSRIKDLEKQKSALDLGAFNGNVSGLGSLDKLTKLLEIIGNLSQTDLNRDLNNQTGTVQELNTQIQELENLRKANADLSASFGNFNNSAGALAQSLSTFPTEVGHNVNGKVEVIINGAQAFQTMQPELANLVTEKINSALNDYTIKNFPQLRPNNIPNKNTA